MEKFRLNEYSKEIKYIRDNYLSKVEIIKTYDNNSEWKKHDVLFCGLEYRMYKRNLEFGDDILLVPKNINDFKDDFEDIIRFSYNGFGIHMSFLKRVNNLVENNTYDYLLNNFGNSDITCSKCINKYDDSDNKFYKLFKSRNISISDFLLSRRFLDLYRDTNMYIYNIKRNKNITLLDEISPMDMKDFNNQLNPMYITIDDNESGLIEILNGINLDNKKMLEKK